MDSCRNCGTHIFAGFHPRKCSKCAKEICYFCRCLFDGKIYCDDCAPGHEPDATE